MKISNNKIQRKSYNTPIFLLILSFAFSFYYIELGFALKPFMIFCLIFFVLSLKNFYIDKLRVFEVWLLIFFVYYCMTGLYGKYPDYSIRMTLGVILVLFCYFVIKYILSIASIKGIEKSIAIGGIVFNGLSLVLYVAGLVSLNFVLVGNQIEEYGVVMDRGFPRLIGLTKDPNIYCFYNFIFFFYYLTHLDKKWSKLGLGLSALTILLTLSRGGLLSLVFGLIFMFMTASLRKKIKMFIVIPISFFIMNLLSKLLLNVDIIQMTINRFTADDGGSGRDSLWQMALYFFNENPIFGVGIFNFRPSSQAVFGEALYLHNSYLEVLSEGGLIGLVLYLIVFLTVFIIYYLNRKLIKDNGYLIFTFTAISVMMATYSLNINEIFFLILALVARYLIEINRGDVPLSANQDEERSPSKFKKRKKYRIVWKKVKTS